jgi:hypothetical protein
MVGGRPAPPRPPSGPIARVSPGLPRVSAASAQVAAARTRPVFGLPATRRNLCPHFYVTGPRGPIPITAPHLLKAYIRHETVISRCQIRGGVHLDPDYVTEVCATPAFNQCIFYEDRHAGR